jgi:hypothetical protein
MFSLLKLGTVGSTSTCLENSACGISFEKDVVWSVIWPAYWMRPGSASFSEATDPPVFPAKWLFNTSPNCLIRQYRGRPHDGEFVQPGLSARREPQSQPHPDTERRARRKPKDQNDTGPGRDQDLFGRNK